MKTNNTASLDESIDLELVSHCWKQPIPVIIPQLEQSPFLKTVFQLLLIRCANKETLATRPDGSTILLQRGQCIVGRYEFAESLGLDREQSMRVERAFSLLKASKLMSKRRSRNCSVVSIKFYDNYVNLSNQMSFPRAYREHTASTNNRESVREGKKSPRSQYSSIETITDEVINQVATERNILPSKVKGVWDELVSYCDAHEKSYKNYKAALINWILKRLEDGRIKRLGVLEAEYERLKGEAI